MKRWLEFPDRHPRLFRVLEFIAIFLNGMLLQAGNGPFFWRPGIQHLGVAPEA